MEKINYLSPEPVEKKENNGIRYTSVAEAVEVYKKDPYGEKVFCFLASAYGISNVPAVLETAGMGEYLQYKQEGRMIGLVATQILKPTFYFLSNAIVLGELAKKGLPTALMIFDYPQDVFNPRNHDKTSAFGNIEFWLDHQNSVRIKVDPVNRSINSLSGIPCDQIMVKISQVFGPGNLKSSISAGLGLNIPQDNIFLTDFYRLLWIQSINRLRHLKVLPDESQMPMFFVDMKKLYSTLAQHSKPLQFFSLLGEQNSLLHSDGMMDPASYYPLQVAWPDLYLECSSCGGEKFVSKLHRAQQARYAHNLPEVQVRLPDSELPELEKLCLHPTGRVADLTQIWKAYDNQLHSLANQLKEAPKSEKPAIREQLKNIQSIRDQNYSQTLAYPEKYFQNTNFVLPERIAQLYQGYLQYV